MPSPRARTVVASSIFTWSCHNHHRPPRIATTFLTHRPLPPRSAASASFSTTHPSQYAIASRRDPTYYDVLNVPVTATPAEIKKSFYALSLLHHPDRNPTSPTTAAERFAQISTAYHVLSNPSKRATYDRDNGIVASSMTKPGHQHPMGSYSSHSHGGGGPGGYTYAGSRPASGLSNRRGAFRGPPPSFYAHGGYGRQQTAAGPGTAGPGTAPGSPGPGPGPGPAGAGARRTTSTNEEDPTSFIYNNSVPHFNAKGHFRTQSAEDVRRRQRRYREMRRQAEMEADAQNATGGGGLGDAAVRFVIVSGILFVAASVVAVFQSPVVREIGSTSSSSASSSTAASSYAAGGGAYADYASKKKKES